MFEAFDAAEFDKRAAECDEFLRRHGTKDHQPVAEESRTTDAQLMRRIEAMVDAKIEAALDEAFDQIGDVVGDFLREVDQKFKQITEQTLDTTIAARARSAEQNDDVKRTLKTIQRSMATLAMKVDAARGEASNVMPLVRGHA